MSNREKAERPMDREDIALIYQDIGTLQSEVVSLRETIIQLRAIVTANAYKVRDEVDAMLEHMSMDAWKAVRNVRNPE